MLSKRSTTPNVKSLKSSHYLSPHQRFGMQTPTGVEVQFMAEKNEWVFGNSRNLSKIPQAYHTGPVDSRIINGGQGIRIAWTGQGKFCSRIAMISQAFLPISS